MGVTTGLNLGLLSPALSVIYQPKIQQLMIKIGLAANIATKAECIGYL